MSTNHGKEFTAAADLRGRFDAIVPSAAGQVQLEFLDGATANIQVNKGVQYNLHFVAVLAAGTGVTGAVFY